MYILKIKGKARIPDFIQVRGEDFTLIGYFRMDTLEQNLGRFFPGFSEKFCREIRELPYGRFLQAEK